jgi:tetratricopeptide (TPR) repeat protein
MSIPRTVSIPVAIVIMLVSVIGGVMVWWLMMRPSPIAWENDAVTPIVVETVQALALDDAGRGDLDAALRLYDRQIAARPDGDEKRELLLGKSSLATSRGRFADAIAAAKQAVSLSGKDNQEALRALAEAYAASGDKKQALLYYKKMLDGAPKGDAPSAKSLQRGPSIEAIVKELEKSA